MQGSDLGGQIIAMIQRESFQQPQQQTSDIVERLTDDQTDEKRIQTDTLIQSEEKLDFFPFSAGIITQYSDRCTNE